MDVLQELRTLGVELPSPAYLIGASLFIVVGWTTTRRCRFCGIAELKVKELSQLCWFFWTLRGTESSSWGPKILAFWMEVAARVRGGQVLMLELQSSLGPVNTRQVVCSGWKTQPCNSPKPSTRRLRTACQCSVATSGCPTCRH